VVYRPISYRGNTYAPDEFERQFNPRALNQDMDAQLEERQRLATATREKLPFTPNVPYGSSPRQIVDIYPGDPARAGACADILFFHGGYWRAGHGSENCFVAEPITAAGGTVIMASYDLCPQVTIGEIVRQARACHRWVVQHGRAYGIDPDNLWIGGHSAGAHLSAMILADPEAPPVAGAMLASGIYDLGPVRDISINEEIRATADDVGPWSPLIHPPQQATRMILPVGAEESEEWRRQTDLYAEVAQAVDCKAEIVLEPEADHLQMLFNLRLPDGVATRAILNQMRL